MLSSTPDTRTPVAGADFRTTHWSVVLAAGADEAAGRKALEQLCQTYWYPLYAFVRRRGYNPHDAQDSTQEFLLQLIERKSLQSVAPERGRFRSFLLVSLKNFLINEWTRSQRQKRGGGQTIISLDEELAEGRYRNEPVTAATPETIFERAWAEALLERVFQRVAQEYEDSGKRDLFEQLKPSLAGEKDSSTYAEIAVRHGISEGAVKMSVFRMRQRYAALLREEIAQTLDRPEEVEDEIRFLMARLAVPSGGS
jgi:RNA polymerase sigma factor (sigma-70 family)